MLGNIIWIQIRLDILLEEVQGAGASSLFPPPLFQDTWPCVQLLCAEHNAPCQWDLETKPNLQHLQQNNRAMIRQICNVKTHGTVTIRSIELLAQLGIEDLDLSLKEEGSTGMNTWNGSKSAVKTACDIQVDGKHGQLTERDDVIKFTTQLFRKNMKKKKQKKNKRPTGHGLLT